MRSMSARLGRRPLLAAMTMIAIDSSPLTAQVNTYRVVVMGEDSDSASVRRTSSIYSRVVNELRRPLSRSSFDVLDEDYAAAVLGFKFPQERNKRDVISASLIANRSAAPNVRARFLVLFRVFAFVDTLSFTKSIVLRISGDIYDDQSGVFVDSFETSPTMMPAPLDCNTTCVEELTGSRARDLSAQAGVIIERQLSSYVSNSGRAVRPSGVNVVQTMSITLRNFSRSQMAQLIGPQCLGSMRDSRLQLLESDDISRQYKLDTPKDPEEILDLLRECTTSFGIRERDFTLRFGGDQILLEKISR